jgi:hypothetical protein
MSGQGQDGLDLDANGREELGPFSAETHKLALVFGSHESSKLGETRLAYDHCTRCNDALRTAHLVLAAGWVSPAAVAERDAEIERLESSSAAEPSQQDESHDHHGDRDEEPRGGSAVRGGRSDQHAANVSRDGVTLAPVSGAVEGAEVVRLTADPARVVPCPHGPLDVFHLHRSTCPVRADLPVTAVAGHEQEVRAKERPESWQAGDQVTRTYTRDEKGVWREPEGRADALDAGIDYCLNRGTLSVSHLAARTPGVSES